MKLKFMIYLVITSLVVTAMAEWSNDLRVSGDNRSDLCYWFTLAVFCVGSLITLRRAIIDGVIDNN
jgi:hypothetical protein